MFLLYHFCLLLKLVSVLLLVGVCVCDRINIGSETQTVLLVLVGESVLFEQQPRLPRVCMSDGITCLGRIYLVCLQSVVTRVQAGSQEQ